MGDRSESPGTNGQVRPYSVTPCTSTGSSPPEWGTRRPHLYFTAPKEGCMEPQRSVFDFGITVERLPDGRWAVTCPSDEFAGMYGTGSWTVPTYDDAIDLVRAAAGLISGARALVEVGSQKIDDMAAAACHASRTTVSGDAP